MSGPIKFLGTLCLFRNKDTVVDNVFLTVNRRAFYRGLVRRSAPVAAVLAGVLPLTSAHAALHNRGNGLIYDDGLNITWMQDANYAATQYAQTGGAVGTANGEMTWHQAKDWAANLTYAGYDDWRLPKALPLNGSNYVYNGIAYDGTKDEGFNITSPDVEMSYLYYEDLGNISYATLTGHVNPAGGLTNTGPFANVALTGSNGGEAFYWSGSADESNPGSATIRMFDMVEGYEGQEYYVNYDSYIQDPVHFVWAVRDGDVNLQPYAITSVDTTSGQVTSPFTSKQGFTPTGQPVGTISSIIGSVDLVKPDGTHVPVTGVGQQVSPGDVFQTGSGASINIQLNDNTTYVGGADTTVHIDDVVNSPADAPHEVPSVFIDTLKSVFQYTAGIIGKKDPGPHQINLPVGSLGIRGDASDYINGNYLNPAAQLQVGSPITLSTPVDVPDSAFTLSFKYIYLTDGGTLTVKLDDQVIGTITGSSDITDTFELASFDITDPSILDLNNVLLSFTFDGTHGDQVILDDVTMPGLTNGDFTQFDQGWSATGPGSASLTATIQEDYLNELLSIPEPASVTMMLIVGAGIVGSRRRPVD